jgi:predicted N-acetyltransferase YhbS
MEIIIRQESKSDFSAVYNLIKSAFRQENESKKELGHSSVIVLGHEHYYPKFGFEPADKWNIISPFKVPADVLWE